TARHAALREQPADIDLKCRIIAGLHDLRFTLALGLFDGLLDAGRVHAAVGDQPVEGLDGDRLPDLVKAGDDDHAGRVVDDDVDAGGLLDRADVAALAPDDAPLHVVGGDRDSPDRALGGVLRRV